jgi:seryl-tRNA synthetase|tara:strand:+ start:58 stop:243 length:186 start_codon:yes stop_codon:yes gene_type:complete
MKKKKPTMEELIRENEKLIKEIKQLEFDLNEHTLVLDHLMKRLGNDLTEVIQREEREPNRA